ncbi:MAG: DUF3048 domain-containing protein [Eubacteriales bacterium]|nr:DUF3048 domain-containing protein [Eubacteriales bacterium]
MKRARVLLLVAVAAAMMALAGCGSSDDASTELTSIKEKIPEATTESATTAATAEETQEEEDTPPAEGMVRSVLTNEWIDEDLAQKRPIAVMYPINREAQPQYGLSNVDVFYEIMEEGDMSRQLGIIQDWEDLDRIGNIRSIRDYFVYAALEWDPIIIHFGGPELYVKDILTRSDVDNINGTGGAMGSDYGAYYRIPAGSTSEHTAYTDGQHISDAIDKAGFSRDHRSEYYTDKHFEFASEKNPNTLDEYSDAVEATDIDMTGCYPVTKSGLTYNESDHLYYKTLYGEAQKDGETGEQMTFSNILIQKAYYEVRDAKGYLAFQMHDTTRDGYFITEGKMIHVTWKKEGDYKPTTFYDDNGQEITLNTGKTMIFVIKEDDSFKVNGTTYND